MHAPVRAFFRRRVPIALAMMLSVLLVAGASSGQMGPLARSVGEPVNLARSIGEPDQPARSVGEANDRELYSGRLAVEPDELVGSRELSSTPSSLPGAIAFSEPESVSNGVDAAGQAGDGQDPDLGATSVAGGRLAPTSPPPESDTPRDSQQPSTQRSESAGPGSTTAPTSTVVPGSTTAPSTTPPTTRTGNTVPVDTTTVPAPPTTVGPTSGDAHTVGLDGRIRGGTHDGRSFSDAVRVAGPGEHFEFVSGTHAPILVSGAHGSAKAPIVISAADPSAPPRFSSGSYERSAGLFVNDSSHLVFRDLDVRRSLWGVLIERSTGVTLERLDVRDLGQEGIRVADRSAWVTIRNSTIADTGRRPGSNSSGQEYSNFGEGIYLGNGSTEDDPVSNVVIAGNDIFGTGTEAIDIKAPVTGVTVRNNRIHDIVTGTSGAIVAHLAADYSAVNPGIRIEGNEIWNISTRTQWRDGVGIVAGSSVSVRNNTFRNIEHYGIRIEDGGAQGSNITATLEGNSFSGIGIDAVWRVAGRATLELSGNTGLN